MRIQGFGRFVSAVEGQRDAGDGVDRDRSPRRFTAGGIGLSGRVGGVEQGAQQASAHSRASAPRARIEEV